MEMEDSSNSTVFSDIIVQLFKEHGIPEEKTSQLKADLTKVPFQVIVRLLMIF